MAIDPRSLLEAARCYECYGASPYMLKLMELALLAQISITGGGITQAALGLYAVNTVADLKAIQTTTGTPKWARTFGNLSPGDSGGREYYWSETSTATPDDMSVVQPNDRAGAGRWLEIE